MTKTEIITSVYRSLIALMDNGAIPIVLDQRNIVGTVQDDPFDRWIEQILNDSLPQSFEVFHAGNLTTPDIVIRDKNSGQCIGIEVKKLIQMRNGRDPRGSTMDYNSCLPCGTTLIKVGSNTEIIPCYYLNALLNETSSKIISLIILDGDFLNYDFDIHKESKYANTSEYFHGPYGEGSVRHRRMYTYPNPLNSKITDFYLHHLLIIKKQDFSDDIGIISKEVIRTDKYGNNFTYYIINNVNSTEHNDITTIYDIFNMCKQRNHKERTPAMMTIPAI